MIQKGLYVFLAIIFLMVPFSGYIVSSHSTKSILDSPSLNKDKFSAAVNVIFRHEGRFSNHPNDKGGATMYGVSLRFLSASGLDIDLDGDVDINDILAIDKEDAKSIYKKYWWDKYRYEEINSLPVAIKIFDLAINVGGKKAHKIVQSSCNQLGYHLVVDGVLGDKSLNALNTLSQSDEKKLIKTINGNTEKFYSSLVNTHPELRVFLKGWLNRVNDPIP